MSFWRKHHGSVDYLASVRFSEDCTPEELERVAALGTAASLHAGSIVEETALVDHRPRRATVVADTDLKLIRFDHQHFRRLLEESPRARNGVLAVLEARMQR